MTTFLFSGHLMDRPDRLVPRFPPSMESAAAAAIAAALDRHGAGAGDLCLSQAASGGDILFLEACQRRGVTCRILLPFDVATFEQTSVRPSLCGDRWADRFHRVIGAHGSTVEEMPTALGPTADGSDPYEACNLWLFDQAIRSEHGRLCFICLWNGEGSEGPGGTAHMVSAVQARGGLIEHIDTRLLA